MESGRKKGLPIGISDYKNLIDWNGYYVDKTMLIKEITDDMSSIILFTRPRRFGKTLNMSMIQRYFEKTDEDNSYLFRDKKIFNQGEYYTNGLGKYPVMFITLKDIKEDNYNSMYDRIKSMIVNLYDRFNFVLESDKISASDQQIFRDILFEKANEGKYKDSLKILPQILEKYYSQKVMILIDEYDTPINSAHVNGYEREAINFMRGFLSGALKDNSSVYKGILTGINRIAKENLFSGLNNIRIYTVLDKQYAQYFGITEDELKEMLKYYDMEFTMEVKQWYDGYNIGDYEIYNPWSILNYASDKTLKPYWVNTASNDLIVECMQNSNNRFK